MEASPELLTFLKREVCALLIGKNLFLLFLLNQIFVCLFVCFFSIRNPIADSVLLKTNHEQSMLFFSLFLLDYSFWLSSLEQFFFLLAHTTLLREGHHRTFACKYHAARHQRPYFRASWHIPEPKDQRGKRGLFVCLWSSCLSVFLCLPSLGADYSYSLARSLCVTWLLGSRYSGMNVLLLSSCSPPVQRISPFSLPFSLVDLLVLTARSLSLILSGQLCSRSQR
jgi:hypothetical protein